jgi:hypothetical protein
MYVYDDIAKLCRQKAEVIKNHENEHVCSIGHYEARQRKHKGLKFGGRATHTATRIQKIVTLEDNLLRDSLILTVALGFIFVIGCWDPCVIETLTQNCCFLVMKHGCI